MIIRIKISKRYSKMSILTFLKCKKRAKMKNKRLREDLHRPFIAELKKHQDRIAEKTAMRLENKLNKDLLLPACELPEAAHRKYQRSRER
jgi:hypothetical protein